MSWSGFYDTAVILSIVGLIAVGAGYACERWEKRRKKQRALNMFRSLDAYKQMAQAMHDVEVVCGTAFYGPLNRMADRMRAMPAPAGTVQNPSDPSPRPHVQRWGSRFPR